MKNVIALIYLENDLTVYYVFLLGNHVKTFVFINVTFQQKISSISNLEIFLQCHAASVGVKLEKAAVAPIPENSVFLCRFTTALDSIHIALFFNPKDVG